MANNPTDRKLLDEWDKLHLLALLLQAGYAKIVQDGGKRYIVIKKTAIKDCP